MVSSGGARGAARIRLLNVSRRRNPGLPQGAMIEVRGCEQELIPDFLVSGADFGRVGEVAAGAPAQSAYRNADLVGHRPRVAIAWTGGPPSVLPWG